GISSALAYDKTLGSSMTNAVSAEVGAQFARNGGTSEQLNEATQLSTAASEAHTSARAYESSVAASRQVGFSSETTGAQFLQNMRNNGTLGSSGAEMYSMVTSMGEDAESVYASNLAAVNNSNIGGTASADEK